MKFPYIAMLLLVAVHIWANDTSPVQVKDVQINISGYKTKKRAVRKRLNVLPEMRFSSKEELQKAVDNDVQELINLRVFLEVDGRIQAVASSTSEYNVIYTIKDALTFIPIPLLLYDSNTGGFQILYIQIWDNVFGSLINWFSIGNLTLRSDGNNGVETGPWLFSPKISNIRLGSMDLAISIEQERVESSRFDNKANQVSSYRYDRTALSLELEQRFGPNKDFYYTVKPGAEFHYGYTDFINLGGYKTAPFQADVFQSIYFDDINTYYNSRRGLRTGISNTLRLMYEDDQWKPVIDFSAEIGYYMAFGKRGRFSYYPRLSGILILNDTYEKLGEPIRGIPDATMDGNFALYLNQTFGIGIWRWKNVWDLHIHPWFDLGIALNGTRTFSDFNDIRKAVGADILLFIEKVPNLVFRFSWGVDLDPYLPWEDKNKTEFIVRYSYSY